MGWALGTDLPAAPPDYSVTVAVISALGVVLVALIGLAGTWAARSSRTPEPAADPKMNERVVVTETLVQEDRRTLAQLDRHVDGIGDMVDRLRWEMDDMKGWRQRHDDRHQGKP